MDVLRTKPKPKIPPMQRRIKPNPKYEKIQPAINTGYTVRKQMEKMQEVSHYYRFRPDEIFRRITVTSLVSLMVEQAKLEIQEADERARLSASKNESDSSSPAQDGDSSSNNKCEEDGSADSALGDCTSEKNNSNEEVEEEEFIESVVCKGKMIRKCSSIQSHSKSVANLIQGFGDVDDSDYGFRKVSNSSNGSSGFYQHHHHDSSMAASTFLLPGAEDEIRSIKSEQLHRSVSEGHLLKDQQEEEVEATEKVTDKPYLILDIRSAEQFDAGHIVGSRNYHHIRLCRACNFETKDMLAYKNREGKLIVVYDYDETLASKFATTLIERGYDNVFMLSGGLRVAYIKFPERLVTGASDVDRRTFAEDDVRVLDDLLDEALTHGTGRLSLYAPSSVASSRMSQQQYHLSSRMSSSRSSLANARSCSPQKRKPLPLHAPLRNSVRTGSHRRS